MILYTLRLIWLRLSFRRRPPLHFRDVGILPIPVDLEVFAPATTRPSRPKALFVGRADDPRKNIGLLVEGSVDNVPLGGVTSGAGETAGRYGPVASTPSGSDVKITTPPPAGLTGAHRPEASSLARALASSAERAGVAVSNPASGRSSRIRAASVCPSMNCMA